MERNKYKIKGSVYIKIYEVKMYAHETSREKENISLYMQSCSTIRERARGNVHQSLELRASEAREDCDGQRGHKKV